MGENKRFPENTPHDTVRLYFKSGRTWSKIKDYKKKLSRNVINNGAIKR